MFIKREADERGVGKHGGWLDSRHSFSFANYYDPNHMGFRALRVINDDRIAAGAGFPTHGHRDMEIMTYVLDGAIAHEDSIGNGAVIKPGEVQIMSAGTGIMHSEFNPNGDQDTRMLQIWIEPDQLGVKPRYNQESFDADRTDGTLALIAAPHGAGGVVDVHQDVFIHAGRLRAGGTAHVTVQSKDRHVWVQVAKGDLKANGKDLSEGDGLAISEADLVEIEAVTETEVLVFDLA